MTKKEYILDFLKEINYAYNHPAMYDDLKRLLDEMEEEVLESAKISSVHQKIGHWDFTKHYGRDYYVCSFCGMERMNDHSSGWNYCPNCGAKMQEVQDEIGD